MITKYRTAKNRYWLHDKVEVRQFERETDKCLFDFKGRKTLKESSYEIFHDTEDQASAHIEMLRRNAERKESLQRLKDSAPQLLEALEAILESYVNVFDDAYCQLELDENEDSIVKARAAIAVAKGQ